MTDSEDETGISLKESSGSCIQKMSEGHDWILRIKLQLCDGKHESLCSSTVRKEKNRFK